MTIHISAFLGCQLGCTYCYEEPGRPSKEQIQTEYDVDAIIETLKPWREMYPEVPGFHGGEPLLMPFEDLKTLMEFISEHWAEKIKETGQSIHVQTNGVAISDKHIELFKEHNVSVGISCDGPGELNSERKARIGDDDLTDHATDRTTTNILKCKDAGLHVGIITVLHKTNAGTDERLEKLLEWMDMLNKRGISGHFNPAIPYESVQTDISLSPERLKEVFLATWEWMKQEDYRKWDPMRGYQDNLIGNSLGDCVNNKCDPYNTIAAKVVTGDGGTGGCGKTWAPNADGVPFLQGPSTGNDYGEGEERYEMLKQVPMEEGGCHGCPYWNHCQGGCPGSAIDEDWRNRTIWCEAKYALYEAIEKDMRAMFPNIRLTTDLPWDADYNELANAWQLDIKPWAAMDPGIEGRSSVAYGYRHEFGPVRENVPAGVLPPETPEEQLKRWQDTYGEDNVYYDAEGVLHADSDHPISKLERVEDAEGGEEVGA